MARSERLTAGSQGEPGSCRARHRRVLQPRDGNPLGAKTSPASVCLPAVAPPKMLFPADVRTLQMPRAPRVTVAVRSPSRVYINLPSVVGWTAGTENSRAHTRSAGEGEEARSE